MTKFRLSRRAFLAGAAAPLLLPARARAARSGAPATPVTGHIGTGPRGRALLDALREHAAAVCDVDAGRLRQGAVLTRAGTRTYTDYREILARPDIDAVVIATPSHWHAVQAVQACEAGKDVYLEIPVCTSPVAGRKLVRAAARAGAVVQTGNLTRHTPAYAALAAALPGLGGVTEIVLSGQANPVGVAEAAAEVPEGLRWAEWLGPGPARAYTEGFAGEGWRWRLDFGGGQIFHQGAQLLETAVALLDLPLDTAFGVETRGEAPASGDYDCPQPFEATWTLGSPAIRITWAQNATAAPSLELRGPNGTLRAEGVGAEFRVDAALLEKLPEETRTAAPDPLARWKEAMATRKAPLAGLSAAVLAAGLAGVANASYRLRRAVAWDPATGTCAGDTVADRLLAQPGSGPWRI